MKKLLITLTATLLCADAFGQGKLAFEIDYEHLIYFATDGLLPPDRSATANGTGTAFPIAGSGLYTGPGSTIAALAGSPTFIAGLYAGTSAGSLSLATTTTIGDAGNEGSVVPVNITFPTFPAGTPIFLQVQVYDSRFAGSAAAWAVGAYAGVSQIFQATPAAGAAAPIWVTNSPVNSTWAPGTFPVVDMVQYGPGFYGGIAVDAGMHEPPPTPPFIYSQPQSTTNYWGQNATFTVGASSGLPMYYQWQANGTNLYDSPHISGSATKQLVVRSITVADAGSYRVMVFNCCGSALSSSAILTVLGTLSITQQPISQVGYWAKSITFDVAATGSPLPGYQWQKDGAVISGATRTSLLLTNLQATNAGRYTVVVSNSLGSITSSNAYLIMNPPGVSLALYSGLTIDGAAGWNYGLQCNAGLTNSNEWQGMTNLTLNLPTELWFDLQPATQHQRFYRVVPGPITIP